MTIANVDSFVVYRGNGATVNFPYLFRIPDPTFVEIYIRNFTTKEVIDTLTTADYSITGTTWNNYSGGIVTLSPALSSEFELVIKRLVPIEQELDLNNQGGFYADSVEQAFDRLTMIAQQLEHGLERSLKVVDGDAVGTLPSAANRADKIFTFNSAGDPDVTALTGFKGDKGDPGTGGNVVATRTALANLTVTEGDSYYLTEAGREGQFVYRTGDFSALVTADTQQGLYVPLVSNPSGSAGAFVRQQVDPRGWPIEVFGGGTVKTRAQNTAALRGAVKVKNVLGSMTVLFGRGEYQFDNSLDPNQPPASGVFGYEATPQRNAVHNVGANFSMIGAGKFATRLTFLFPFKEDYEGTIASGAKRMIVHDGNFECAHLGLIGDGNTDTSTFTFWASNNNNAMICCAAIPSGTWRGNENIHDCLIRAVPGFPVGTSLLNGAYFRNNDVEFCANGYNNSGRDILFTGNRVYWSEGVESSAADIDQGFPGEAGRIVVDGNIFINCSLGASLGGNFSSDPDADSFGYSFSNNVVHNDTHSISAACIVALNAHSCVVVGNVFKGKMGSAISLVTDITTTDTAIAASPGNTTVSGNDIDIISSAGVTAAITLGHGEGDVLIAGNRAKLPLGGAFVTANMAGTATARVASSNQVKGARDFVSFVTGQTGKVVVEPGPFLSADSGQPYRQYGGSGVTSARWELPTMRYIAVDDTQMGQASFASRLAAVQSSVAAFDKFRWSYGGTLQWGSGAAAPGVTLAWSETGKLRLSGASDGVGTASLVQRPPSSVTPTANGDLEVQATNTALTFKLKGSDGTVRSATLVLA